MKRVASLPLDAALFIAGIAILGGTVVVLQLAAASRWTGRDLLVWFVLVVAIAVTEQFPIPLRHGAETENFAITGALFPAALILTEPAVLILAVACGSLVGQVVLRWAPYKVAFNVGQHVLGVMLATVIYAAFGAGPGDPATWLAVLMAMSVYFLVNESSVALVISMTARSPFLSVLLPSLTLSVVNWAGNVAIGVLGAIAWSVNPFAVGLVALPLALSYLTYRAWVERLQQHHLMQDMARTADAIASQGDLTKRVLGADSRDDAGALAMTFNQMLERLESSFARERRFLSEASHELRTPLTICRGHLDVLGPKSSREEMHEIIRIVRDELDRTGRIVEDMTTLARMEHPQLLRPRPVALDRLIVDTAMKAVPMLNGRLRVGWVPAEVEVQADPQRLTQGLLNLLDNAAVHTRDDSRVELRVVEEADWWRIEVEDRGGGLPPGEEESLFAPFTRADPAVPGTGLGLSIVRAVARAHGGTAGVDNRPGEGATFWVRVPQ